ncbi:MAG: CBS domain-containing protein [Deltaproteobacteria bacterium]|nr:CBS domain-containing protein [Deltaproteobacteria bacterium]
MLANRIHAIPIVDSEHRIIGILTSTDILRAVVQNGPIELWV